jgi:hypothetical protein
MRFGFFVLFILNYSSLTAASSSSLAFDAPAPDFSLNVDAFLDPDTISSILNSKIAVYVFMKRVSMLMLRDLFKRLSNFLNR